MARRGSAVGDLEAGDLEALASSPGARESTGSARGADIGLPEEDGGQEGDRGGEDFEEDVELEEEEEDEGEEEAYEEDVEIENGGPEDEEMSDEEEDEFSLSQVSNETDASEDFDPPNVERMVATVVPEPPWTGFVGSMKKVLISCLLPFLIVLLLLYTVFRCFKVIYRGVVDVLTCVRQIVWLVIRIALAPLYICGKLLIPSYLRNYVYEELDFRFGRYARLAFSCLTHGEQFFAELPDITVACGFAALETCCFPARDIISRCCWRYAGSHITRKVLTPMHDTHINHAVQKRKQFAQLRDASSKESAKKLAPKKASAKKQALREKAKRMRLKRKRQQLHIKLALPADSGKEAQQVQLEPKSHDELVSRTMIVERRYAVFVGFVWSAIGTTLLISTVDGTDGEQCTICANNEDIGVRVCRHGQGRDCAFQLHSDMIIIAISIIGFGLVLTIYALFIYEPVSKAEIAKRIELQKERAKQDDRIGMMRKQEDPEVQAVHYLREQLQTKTIGRMLRDIYRETPLHSYQQTCGSCSNRPLRAFEKWEERHRVKERSLHFQNRVVAFTMRWGKRLGFIKELSEKEKRKRDPAMLVRARGMGPGGGGRPGLGHSLTMGTGSKGTSTRLDRCCACFSHTRCGRRFSGLREWSPICDRLASAISRLSGGTRKSGSDSGVKRSSAIKGPRSEATGAPVLEEVLRTFGMLELDPRMQTPSAASQGGLTGAFAEEEAAEDAEGGGADAEATDGAADAAAETATPADGTNGHGTNGHGTNGHGTNGHGTNGHGTNGNGNGNGHGNGNGKGKNGNGDSKPSEASTGSSPPTGSGSSSSDLKAQTGRTIETGRLMSEEGEEERLPPEGEEEEEVDLEGSESDWADEESESEEGPGF